jgi:hypothetical protein
MAFMRYANAVVIQPVVSQNGWGKVRKTAAAPSRNLVAQASEILGEPFNPEKYLLTHATIVASVDVDKVPNVKLGRVKVGSKTINRKFSDYYIKPASSKFVNNNGDSWGRDVLMMSYPTFIGGHNFLEHVQIEEQSKGRIIDAVARDIGESVYVDILIATDKRHSQLVKDIKAGKIGTLSMGCSTEITICSKCGNVAVDETELCDCIKYNKLDHFYDDQGQRRVIAELCGHPSLGGTGGVTFIEASWVGTPAFTGATLRNILEPTEVSAEMARRVQAILNTPPPQWDANASQQKQASLDRQGQWGEEEALPPEEGAGDAAPEKSKPEPLDHLVDEVYQMVRDQVKDRVRKDLRKKDVAEALSPEDSTMSPNDTIHKEAGHIRKAYQGTVSALLRTATSDVAFVDGLATINSSFGVRVPVDLYRLSLRVGPIAKFGSLGQFLGACRKESSRPLSYADARVLTRIGSLLTQLGSKKLP